MENVFSFGNRWKVFEEIGKTPLSPFDVFFYLLFL